MFRKAKKYHEYVTLPVTIGAGIFTACAYIADKQRLFDFFDTTFKSPLLFVSFLIILLLFIIVLLLPKYNWIITLSRFLFGLTSLVLLITLVLEQYHRDKYGLLGGKDEGNITFFRVLRKFLDSNVPPFSTDHTDRITYDSKREYVQQKFSRFFLQWRCLFYRLQD